MVGVREMVGDRLMVGVSEIVEVGEGDGLVESNGKKSVRQIDQVERQIQPKPLQV
jgi:hypothetical protein